ncbi:peptide/nickel transport system permease protein [Propionibacterium cyclohexanicum]|uniref:Peptide/nickel transport system permease protein n=1 Tax=Propionibacterium cyclohexanicum TaxID=64702 RepID=A0A1H9TD95_9ACTN|nr:ABC transporter permease [Propionibacterium cyclohexanicum]SER95215.1 peptide/nickel transport system permease protein [Propionibacterium cyclohexanicum]
MTAVSIPSGGLFAAHLPRWIRGIRPTLVLSLLVLAVAASAAIAPGLWTHTDPLHADPLAARQPPSLAHLAGTDIQGRDVLTRIVYGARFSLLIGLGATLVALGLGAILGIVAGVGPRWADQLVTRLVDVVAAFPEVLLALLMIALSGRGAINLALALGVAGLPKYARTIRATVQQTRCAGYVEQATTFGASRWQRLVRHVLPNALGPLPVMVTIGFGGAIISSSGLSFLGLGPQPPAAEWGLMLAESRNYLRQTWWTGVFPGVALTAVVMAATVLGRHLQERYERRLP